MCLGIALKTTLLKKSKPALVTIFSHISVFISIILGLAVVHLLSGVSLILDKRVQTKTYALHGLWTLSMLFVSVNVWLSSFVLSSLETMSAIHFFNLLAYATLVYLMSGLLYPVRGEEVTDFKEHFNENRFRLYVLGILFIFIDAFDGVLEHYNAGVAWDIGQFATLGTWLVFFMIGLKVKNPKFDWGVAIIFFIGLLGWFQSMVVETNILSW